MIGGNFMTTFVCSLKETDIQDNTGKFKIHLLKKFTINTGARVLIRNYGEIKKGVLRLFN
jgi:hypothetical protein